jgi:hypothetical protein
MSVYTESDIAWSPAADGSGWDSATLDLRSGDSMTVTGTNAQHPRDKAAGKPPHTTRQTWHGPGILHLAQAPNGDIRWYSNALEV